MRSFGRCISCSSTAVMVWIRTDQSCVLYIWKIFFEISHL